MSFVDGSGKICRMKINESIAKIPVIATTKPKPRSLDVKRGLSKFTVILVLLLIPTLGIFRVDVSSGFVIMDKQIWFSDFFIVFGFWLALACTFIMFYSTVGTAFCGWVCPQNTFSNLMDAMTKKLLGKRAVIDWENKASKVADRKNKPLNWVLLIVQIIAVSMLVALLPLIYFISPSAIWAFVTFQPHETITNSLYWIYFVFVFITAVNLGVVRHYFCRYMCVYRMWQFLFKTSDTLHIDYDESRKADCEKCNYCTTVCMVDIDPRNTSTFDSCTNCGACISACRQVHEKHNQPGLLKFKFGKRRNKELLGQRSLTGLAQRSRVVIPVMLFGIGMYVWGLVQYEPFHLAVYKSEKHQGEQIDEYRVNIANKLYEPGMVKIEILGLDASAYSITRRAHNFDDVGRFDSFITVNDTLEPGLYSFIVVASSEDRQWEKRIRMQHFVKRG